MDFSFTILVIISENKKFRYKSEEFIRRKGLNFEQYIWKILIFRINLSKIKIFIILNIGRAKDSLKSLFMWKSLNELGDF